MLEVYWPTQPVIPSPGSASARHELRDWAATSAKMALQGSRLLSCKAALAVGRAFRLTHGLVCHILPFPLLVPSGLAVPGLAAANDVSNGPRVTITWNAPTNPNGRIVSYSVLRNGVSLATLPANVTQYLDATVESAQLYSYAIQARTPAGATDSALVAVRVPDGRPEGVATPQVGLTRTSSSEVHAHGLSALS